MMMIASTLPELGGWWLRDGIVLLLLLLGGIVVSLSCANQKKLSKHDVIDEWIECHSIHSNGWMNGWVGMDGSTILRKSDEIVLN
jgi:hypothetical protein